MDRIFAFEGDGCLQQYEGGYTDYLESRQYRQTAEDDSVRKNTGEKKKAPGKEWKQNMPVKLKFSFKEQKEFETIDDDIEALEEKIVSLDEDMSANATNSAKLFQLSEEKDRTEKELEEKMERWVYLNDLAEKIEEQKAGKI